MEKRTQNRGGNTEQRRKHRAERGPRVEGRENWGDTEQRRDRHRTKEGGHRGHRTERGHRADIQVSLGTV